MTPERIEALLAASRPEPASPELRRRVLEAVRARTRPPAFETRWTGRLAVTTAALLLVGTLAWLLGDAPARPAQETRSFEEKRLDTLPPDASLAGPVVWSRDGRHWGCVVRDGNRMAAIIDGRRGETFNRIGCLGLGAGGRYAYLTAAPSSLIVDGAPRAGYERFNHPTWSPDGTTLAFAAQTGAKWRVVVGDAAGEPFDEVDALTWSPDGTTLAYAARILQDRFVVRGAQKLEIFDDVQSLTFSPDGKTLAYVAREGAAHVMIDDRKSPSYVNVEPPVFSGDGSLVGYIAKGDVPYLVLGETRLKLPHPARELTLSHDGRTCAFASLDAAGQHWVTVGRRKDAGWELAEGELYTQVEHLRLSPDGKRLVHVAHKGNRQYLVVDGRPTKKFSRIDLLRLGPDGTPAYVATAYGKSFVMAGETQGGEVDDVLDGPVFSADGRKVAYVALKGGELWARTLDVK
jgi:hypothetical protein